MIPTLTRPTQLPDFLAPPLSEVVLGVQFSTPKNYQQIYAGQVWDLYRDDYPEVQEQMSLLPSFETFGISNQRIAAPQMLFASGGTHDRFWFLRSGGDELIQFQQDRLLHNWRQGEDKANAYPRYEAMITKFTDELTRLQNFMATLSPQSLLINQCEISYINVIPMGETGAASLSDWLRFVDFEGRQPDDLSISTREIIHKHDGSPQARLSCETSTGIRQDGEAVIAMNLTVRGAPSGTDIDSALEFLANGRIAIVTKFTELTTDKAHKIWGRTL